MARFDPNTYPNRLAFEEHARRLRAEEAKRIFRAAAAWLLGCIQGLASGAARSGVAHSHRHSAP